MDKIELPPRSFMPNRVAIDGVIEDEMEDQREMDICEDCICPLTCAQFERCVYQE